jgi:effector-binding domain-containing protein/uncharacterized protein YndB with AHSA1/START domain
MKILKNILLGLGAIIVLLIVVSFFLPSKARVERSTTINASPEVVFAHIKDLKTWNKWSPWAKKDSTMTNTFDGPDGEVGQKSIWKSEEVGNGSMLITELVPNEKLVTKLEFDGRDGGTGTLQLEAVGDSTKVTWSLDADLENTPTLMKPMSKYFFLTLDGMVGGDFEEGLKLLKELVESTPKAEKPSYNVEEVTTEPMIVLVAPKEKVKVEGIKAYLDKNFSELYGFAIQSNVKPGTASAVYYTWDGKETEIEAILPVDKEPANLGGFKIREIPATKALKVDYFGDYKGSESAHMAIGEYAKDKGINVGAPWESYVTDPGTEPDTTKWLTQIYYPVVEGNGGNENDEVEE